MLPTYDVVALFAGRAQLTVGRSRSRKYEQVDHVLSPFIHESGDRPICGVVQPAAN
jgi:hypothetical protein